MVELIAAWLLLGVMSFVVGDAALALFGPSEWARRMDRVLIAFWLGLVLNEWMALTLSFAGPVSPRSYFLIVGLIVVAAVATRGRDIIAPLRTLRSAHLLALAILALTAAFVAAGLRPTPDIGEYHYPAIRWLAEYGTVRGIANLLLRMGSASGLFALTAPFDELLPGRATGIINGFVLCLTLGQVVTTTARIGTGQARRSDWFLWGGSLGLLGIESVVGSFTTTAPELGVAALTLIIAWQMLARDEDHGSAGSMIPLALACGALVTKISALLLVPIVALYVVIGRGARWWGGAVILGTFLVAPVVAASLVASGCVAINVAASCLPVPWVVSDDIVHLFSRYLLEWSRWGHYAPSDAGPWDWIPVWLAMPLNILVLVPFALSLIAFLGICRGRPSRGECWILALILPSIVLVFISSPDPRYNYGLFLAPVALLIARVGPMAPASLTRWTLTQGGNPLPAASALALLMGAGATAIELHHGYALGLDRLLTPRPAPTIAVTQHREDGLSFVAPDEGSGCWRAMLPCAARDLGGVTLLAPERGLAGGFRRSQ